MNKEFNTSSIDWNLSIKLANNNSDLARDLLQMFVTDLAKSRPNILSAFRENDFQMLKQQIHKLHGASCYCGVAKLTDLLRALELLLVKEDQVSENEVKVLIQAFDNEVTNILNDYKHINI
jgi:two-component system sensor histidine kinase BarA